MFQEEFLRNYFDFNTKSLRNLIIIINLNTIIFFHLFNHSLHQQH